MKRIFAMLLVALLTLGLTGCALTELIHENDNVVDLGNGKNAVKWNLVKNDNDCRPVESAYFLFDQDTFQYYENGELKKEGTHRITYLGRETTNRPLCLNLKLGEDENGFSVYDSVDCYTEDSREDLHQFTVVSEGYHVETVRAGGVPIRDYHLSDMPYAFGTYVKEGSTLYEYQSGRVDYLGCAKLNGSFCDEKGNRFYFVHHSYSTKAQASEYESYTVYMRYENQAEHSVLEGTIKLSWFEDWDTGKRHEMAVIHVLHGENEPGAESGTYAVPDYQLRDFVFDGENSFTFLSGDYFHDNRECDYDPAHFVGGTYSK